MHMGWHRRGITLLLLVLVALTGSAVWAGNKKRDTKAPAESPSMNDRQRAVHALNRLTFGPRPGDVDRVMAMGLDKWIDLQLHPEKIDDSALAARLAPLRTLKMDTREMIIAFPPRQLVKAVENGRMSMPSDPAERAIYQAKMQRLQQKQAQVQNAAEQQNDSDGTSMTGEKKNARRKAREFAEAKY